MPLVPVAVLREDEKIFRAASLVSKAAGYRWRSRRRSRGHGHASQESLGDVLVYISRIYSEYLSMNLDDASLGAPLHLVG